MANPLSDKGFRNILVAFLLTAATGAGAWEDSIYMCGTATPTLNFCQREVKRIKTVLKRLDANWRRTGKGYNAGNSLVGCAADCMDLYPSLKDKAK
jgi:hypothetical protein